MKKKKVVKLVILVLIIIALIIGVKNFVNNGEQENKLANIYKQLQTTQNYLFEMERNDENKVILAKNGNNTLVDQYSKDNHSTTIVKDNHTYLVLHNREEYYVYENNNVNQNILMDEIKGIIEKTFITGTERIKGRRYNYEEYAGSTIFTISNTLDENEENIKTRFFFDNEGNLAYIKTMTNNNQELLKVKLEMQVDDSIFEIPSNYAEN